MTASKRSRSKMSTRKQKEEEESLAKRMEPIAPWNRSNIPDHGPLSDRMHGYIFLVIGILATLVYESSNYFTEIDRWLAYLAIWFPLWFRFLGQLSPALTEEQQDTQEKLQFQQRLQQIQDED